MKAPRLFTKDDIFYIEHPTGERYSSGRPKYKRTSLETQDEKEAQDLLLEWLEERESTDLEELVRRETITLGQAIDNFLKDVKANKEHGTYRTYKSPLLRFKDFVGPDLRLRAITQEHLDTFITACRTGEITRANKPASIYTTNAYIRALKAFANRMVRYKYLRESPFKYRPQDIPDEKPTPAFADEYIEPFINGIEDIDIRHLTAAYLLTGCRRNELLNLEWRDIDGTETGHGWIFIRKSKSHLCGKVFINKQLRKLLDQIGKNNGKDPNSKVFKQMHLDTLTHRFKAEVRKSKLPIQDLNVHSMRHSVGMRMNEQGYTIVDIQKRLRHRNISTTLRYTSLSDERLQEVSEDSLGRIKLTPTKKKGSKKRKTK